LNGFSQHLKAIQNAAHVYLLQHSGFNPQVCNDLFYQFSSLYKEPYSIQAISLLDDDMIIN